MNIGKSFSIKDAARFVGRFEGGSLYWGDLARYLHLFAGRDEFLEKELQKQIPRLQKSDPAVARHLLGAIRRVRPPRRFRYTEPPAEILQPLSASVTKFLEKLQRVSLFRDEMGFCLHTFSAGKSQKNPSGMKAESFSAETVFGNSDSISVPIEDRPGNLVIHTHPFQPELLDHFPESISLLARKIILENRDKDLLARTTPEMLALLRICNLYTGAPSGRDILSFLTFQRKSCVDMVLSPLQIWAIFRIPAGATILYPDLSETFPPSCEESPKATVWMRLLEGRWDEFCLVFYLKCLDEVVAEIAGDYPPGSDERDATLYKKVERIAILLSERYNGYIQRGLGLFGILGRTQMSPAGFRIWDPQKLAL